MSEMNQTELTLAIQALEHKEMLDGRLKRRDRKRLKQLREERHEIIFMNDYIGQLHHTAATINFTQQQLNGVFPSAVNSSTPLIQMRQLGKSVSPSKTFNPTLKVVRHLSEVIEDLETIVEFGLEAATYIEMPFGEFSMEGLHKSSTADILDKAEKMGFEITTHTPDTSYSNAISNITTIFIKVPREFKY